MQAFKLLYNFRVLENKSMRCNVPSSYRVFDFDLYSRVKIFFFYSYFGDGDCFFFETFCKRCAFISYLCRMYTNTLETAKTIPLQKNRKKQKL